MDKVTISQKNPHINRYIYEDQYIADKRCGFKYMEFPAGKASLGISLTHNVIIFIVEGGCSFSCDQFSDIEFIGGDMCFIQKSAVVDGVIFEDVKLVYMTFDELENPLDRKIFEHMHVMCRSIVYNFMPLKMNNLMVNFVNTLIFYLKNRGDCTEMNDIKHKELFLILHWSYTKEQLAAFFHPIIGRNIEFRNFILDNYTKCTRLEELIERSNMHPNTFMIKFKTDFGVTAYQWMLKQMCQKIVHKASQYGVTPKDIMIEIGVINPTHFNRVCKRYFNKTPKELTLFYQNKRQEGNFK